MPEAPGQKRGGPHAADGCEECPPGSLPSGRLGAWTLRSTKCCRCRDARRPRRACTNPLRLQDRANVVDRLTRRRLGFGPDGALGPLDPGFCLLGPPLPDLRHPECHVGDAGGRLVGPAVPPGQLDRLPAALGRPRRRRQISTCARYATRASTSPTPGTTCSYLHLKTPDVRAAPEAGGRAGNMEISYRCWPCYPSPALRQSANRREIPSLGRCRLPGQRACGTGQRGVSRLPPGRASRY